MFARFSSVAGERGVAGAERDIRGFALKFYTEEGNWELVGNNTPVFFIRDPLKFSDLNRAVKRDPRTGMRSAENNWDCWTLRPEALHQVTIVMSDRGIPKSWRHMHGFGSHTFGFINDQAQRHWVKFTLKTHQGIENLSDDEARQVVGNDRESNQRDLYDSIERGEFPRWTLYAQIMTKDETDNYYGQASGGKAEGIGTRIYSDGEIQRGQMLGDRLVGIDEVLSRSGGRFVGKCSELGNRQRDGAEIERNGNQFYGTRTGNGATNGTYIRADGSSFMGQMDPGGARVLGRESRTDGSLVEEGGYESNVLSAGTTYDMAGTPTVVDLAAERAATARAAAEAEQLRKREAAMQAEQQFSASLQTMNPGQLFAKADELNTRGDRARAHEAQRALMGRFPDHPLAATTARQMAGESRESTPSNVTSSTSDRDRFSAQACEAMKRTVMTPNASVSASTETV